MKNEKHTIGIKLAAFFLLLCFLIAPMNAALGSSAKYDLIEQSRVNALLNSNEGSMFKESDDALVLRVEIINGKKLLRVSFNANESSDGKLKLVDASGKEVLSANFELIKFPYYATVDITNLTAGTYTANLITQLAIHTSELNID